MDIIKALEQKQIRNDLPDFEIGDYVKVYLKVSEGTRERLQVFEGTVISKKGSGLSETFIVRRMASGIGVEKVMPINSPLIDHIEIVRKGKVRRAKLYYLRDRVGKAAKVKSKINYTKKVKKEKKPKVVETVAEVKADTEETEDTNSAE